MIHHAHPRNKALGREHLSFFLDFDVCKKKLGFCVWFVVVSKNMQIVNSYVPTQLFWQHWRSNLCPLKDGVNRKHTPNLTAPPQATTTSSSPSPLKLWESPQVENTTSSSSSPLKLWGSSSHNTVKHSMDTHTRLDLSVWVKLCVLCRIPIGSQSEMYHHYCGGSSTYPPEFKPCFLHLSSTDD